MAELNVQKERVRYLDLLRLMAFCFIIFYHFFVELKLRGIYDLTAHGLNWETPNMHIATLGVGLFFMLSGAGLMLSCRNGFSLKTFVKKRLLRIYIPFYLVYLLDLAYEWIRRGGSPFSSDIPINRVLLTLAGVDEYFAMWGRRTFSLGIGEWFLGCLIFMYLLFPILQWLVKKAPRLTLAGFTVYYLIFVFTYHYQMQPFMNFFVKIYEFVLGMCLVTLLPKVSPKVLIGTVPGILLFLLLPNAVACPVAVKITILCTLVFLSAAAAEPVLHKKENGALAKVLSLAGRYSFEIYLIHHVVIYAGGRILAGRILSSAGAFGVFLLELVIMAVLGAVITRIADFLRMKAEKLLSRIGVE